MLNPLLKQSRLELDLLLHPLFRFFLLHFKILLLMSDFKAQFFVVDQYLDNFHCNIDEEKVKTNWFNLNQKTRGKTYKPLTESSSLSNVLHCFSNSSTLVVLSSACKAAESCSQSRLSSFSRAASKSARASVKFSCKETRNTVQEWQHDRWCETQQCSHDCRVYTTHTHTETEFAQKDSCLKCRNMGSNWSIIGIRVNKFYVVW